MKRNALIITGVFIAGLIVGGWFTGVLRNPTPGRVSKEYIDSLFRKAQNAVNIDSITSANERKIIDSINVISARYEKRIATIEQGIQDVGKQNKVLLSDYNTISIQRPDY